VQSDIDDACVAWLVSVRLKKDNKIASSLSALQCWENTKSGMAQALSPEWGAMNVRAARRQYFTSRAKEDYIKARVDAAYAIAVAETPSPDTEPASDAYTMKKVFTYANPRRNSTYGRRPWRKSRRK